VNRFQVFLLLVIIALFGALVLDRTGAFKSVSKQIDKAAKSITTTAPSTGSSNGDTGAGASGSGSPGSGGGSAHHPHKPVGPYKPGGLKAIMRQLSNKLGYTPRILEIIISDDFAEVQIQERKNHSNYDEYDWRDGAFGPMQPVQVFSGDDPAPKLFNLETVNLASIPRLHAKAAKLLANAKVDTTIIESALPFHAGIQIMVNVESPRGSKQLRADAHGRVTGVV
jgi:hypothetical protein